MLPLKQYRILITGGTGSLGSTLARQWAGDGHQLTIISRNDHRQAELMADLPQVAFYSLDLGDRKHLPRLERICRGQDLCIHTAAQKVVSMGQYQPSAYISTNIQGTQNICDAWAAAHGNCRRLLAISTDKAPQSLNLYGATKKVGEALVRDYDGSCLRYGNVVTSKGSFIQVWKEAAKQGHPLVLRSGATLDEKLTWEFPTRFYLSMAQAVGLVEEALGLVLIGQQGIFVPNHVWAFDMKDVAEATGLPYEIRPITGYEKLHEILLAPGEGWQGMGRYLGRVVVPHWPDEDLGYYDTFRSDKARRLSGLRVLELAGWWK